MAFDLLIRGGRVIDGTGNPWYAGDIGIQGQRIAGMGNLSGAEAAATLDARGLAVSPGFIDVHSHSDFVLPLQEHPRILEPFIRQGITTLVTGNCGFSPAPLSRKNLHLLKLYSGMLQGGELSWEWESMGELLDTLERQGVALNVANLVPHGGLRIAVMGYEGRAPQPAEMEQMKELLRRSLDEGGWGMSTGLMYPPGMFSDTDELVALNEVLAERGGLFTCHTRGLGEILPSGVREVIKVGERLQIPVQVSHLLCMGQENWPKLGPTFELMERARERGVDVAFDLFPYIAGNTTFLAIYPPWSLDGGLPALLERLTDPISLERIRTDLEEVIPGWPAWLPGAWSDNIVRSTGWENIRLIWLDSAKNKPLEGKSVARIARERGKEPFETAVELTLEEGGRISMLIFNLSGNEEGEEWLQRTLTHPLAAFETDAILTGRGLPHPAAYGTFPRILGRYVRELKLLPMEEAVRRMTSFPAQRLRIKDRGVLREGAYADLVLFNPATVADRATYADPHQFPVGIEQVLINGKRVVEQEAYHGELRAGEVLRRR